MATAARLAGCCRPYPGRLFGIAMLPMQDIALAIGEMQFVRKVLGFRGGFIRPNPYSNKMIFHPDYEPFTAGGRGSGFS